MAVVTMPQMGESVVEGTLERWLVREGERVDRDQNLCEITTDKVDTEIPAPEAGVVTQLLVAEGETIEVGAKLAVITAETAEDAAGAGEDAGRARTAAAVVPPIEPVRHEEPEPQVRATPLARRMAADEGIDLTEVSGSGVSGRVTRADLAPQPVEPQQPTRVATPVAPAVQHQSDAPGNARRVPWRHEDPEVRAERRRHRHPLHGHPPAHRRAHGGEQDRLACTWGPWPSSICTGS